MSFRKFRANRIFDGYRFLEENAVLITKEDGKISGIINFDEAGDDIEYFDGIISPGFINCHCHLELSHMKGMIARDTGLVQFVTDVIKRRHVPEPGILESIINAEDEMLRNGIVAVGDICNNGLTIPQKKKSRLKYHNFIEASGYHPDVVQSRFERAVSILKEYEKYFQANSIVPHAPYSVADELWELLVHYPGNNLFTIHNQETEGENEWFENKTGDFTELYNQLNIDTAFFTPVQKSSLQTYLHKFKENQSVILVHNVHTSEEDLVYAKLPIVNCQLYWCLCPNANKYISGQLPPIELLQDYDCSIVLGTDSLASNDQLSIWEEIKTIRKSFPVIELDEMLTWATSNAAKALQMDSLLGSFEKGKKPGVIGLANNPTRLL